MNGFSSSVCPLCRANYTHFPKVCTQLHYFLQTTFPQQYEARENENKEWETKKRVQSPDIPTLQQLDVNRREAAAAAANEEDSTPAAATAPETSGVAVASGSGARHSSAAVAADPGSV
eukprot:CAMPEP_0202910102 /NCGR_PEP_ID=MMETSP1392-20130828/51113_1 /ASSEMBLY_ACC=CAM_ASM_000868 /TAXON_ID=225041 /ORGANISM="Chlamydomonas chlamydogama, Strain SAG 11-48b" /LENGTH=117 /DNA_ID=CAMNT_0049600093 /DNA_START=70 /DNA_END=420 /DNA_ORIENTATION=-